MNECLVCVEWERFRARRCGCRNTVSSTTSMTPASVRRMTRGTERHLTHVMHVTAPRFIASLFSSRVLLTDLTALSLSAVPLKASLVELVESLQPGFHYPS